MKGKLKCILNISLTFKMRRQSKTNGPFSVADKGEWAASNPGLIPPVGAVRLQPLDGAAGSLLHGDEALLHSNAVGCDGRAIAARLLPLNGEAVRGREGLPVQVFWLHHAEDGDGVRHGGRGVAARRPAIWACSCLIGRLQTGNRKRA